MGDLRWDAANSRPFKRKVVIQAMRGDETVRAIAARHGINANQLSKWKTQAHDGLLEVFDNAAGNPASRETDKLIEQLYARIGELVVERDFFSRGSALWKETGR